MWLQVFRNTHQQTQVFRYTFRVYNPERRRTPHLHTNTETSFGTPDIQENHPRTNPGVSWYFPGFMNLNGDWVLPLQTNTEAYPGTHTNRARCFVILSGVYKPKRRRSLPSPPHLLWDSTLGLVLELRISRNTTHEQTRVFRNIFLGLQTQKSTEPPWDKQQDSFRTADI